MAKKKHNPKQNKEIKQLKKKIMKHGFCALDLYIVSYVCFKKSFILNNLSWEAFLWHTFIHLSLFFCVDLYFLLPIPPSLWIVLSNTIPIQ